MKFTSKKLGNKEFALSRVTVFLGANGAGKSSLLNEAKDAVQQICPGKKAVYIEGGRAITLQHTLQLTSRNVNQFQDFKRAKDTYEAKRQERLSDRVYDALMMLERKELAIKAGHSDAVETWLTNEQKGACPIREVPPLERLFGLFHEIFPRLRIEYNADGKIINVRKASAVYPIMNMSDGEKQVFSILADFVELGDEYGLIVVDEPELNLHPELAERIWNLIESEFPDKIYCYATHSLSFAMRTQVERVIVLCDDPDNITVIEEPSDISSLQLNQFLGSIPGIISAKNVVVTEGTEKSFDSVFYRWILNDDQVEVMPAGDCEQVIKVCRRDGIWSKIVPKVSLTGVIDRDFRNDHSSGEVILQFREAESYLAIPRLAVAADTYIAIKEERLTENDVVEVIMSILDQERNLVYANVVASNCGIRLGVSIERSVLTECRNTDDLIKHLKASSQAELSKAAEAMGDSAIEKLIAQTQQAIDQVLKKRDWLKALSYINGKRLGNEIAHKIGVRNAIDLMRSVAANVDVKSVTEVNALSENIMRVISNNKIQPATESGR